MEIFGCSILGRVRALELELQAVCDEGDELRVGGLALGVGYGVAEDPLEGVEIFIALLVGLMPYDLLGYGYSTIESTKTQLFCICVILYIQRVTRLRIYILGVAERKPPRPELIVWDVVVIFCWPYEILR